MLMPPLHYIIITYFAIAGLIGASIKSFLVFVGALLGLIFPIMAENFFGGLIDSVFNTIQEPNTEKLKCYGQPIIGSTLYKTPLSVYIYAYLSTYFMYVFSANRAWNSLNNTLVFLILGALTLFECYRVASACGFGYIVVGIPLVCGIIWGIIWAAIIGKKNHNVPGSAKGEKCGLDNQQQYQCKLSTNGELLS
jgi:hypothetical protein